MALKTRTEAAEYLRVSPRHFDTWIRPSLRVVKLGIRLVAWDVRDLDAWIDEQRSADTRPDESETVEHVAVVPRAPRAKTPASASETQPKWLKVLEGGRRGR
jgi:predicted DNA-binding transcriptional regulator AlpA